jgi:hypothetical protein
VFLKLAQAIYKVQNLYKRKFILLALHVHPGHQSITHASEERKLNTQCIIKTIPWNYTV